MEYTALFMLGTFFGFLLFPIALMIIWFTAEVRNISRVVNYVLFILLLIIGFILINNEPIKNEPKTDLVKLIVTYVFSLIIPSILYKVLLPVFKK